jgi:lipopolysaccharide transport system permease protein
MAALSLALHSERRAFANRCLGSFNCGLWALFRPLIQLAAYSFVFVYLFCRRRPRGLNIGYAPFLFIGVWPRTMFAKPLGLAIAVIQDNDALIGKLALPRNVFVLSVLR